MAEVSATYRLQLHPGFTFEDAAAIVPYLRALGVSHLYLSPILQAAPGSTHGYDVVDPTRVNEELGGPQAFAGLRAVLRQAGLGLILDVVPNHMAISGPENRWWWDVLEHGPSSRFALYFDIAWNPAEPSLRDRILVPVLADHYGRVLEAGGLRLERQAVYLQVRYLEHVYPLAPETTGRLFQAAALRLPEGEWRTELDAAGEQLRTLPRPPADDPAGAARRHHLVEAVRAGLERLLSSAEVSLAIDETVSGWNADLDLLDEVLEEQHYRLARWQTASWDLDYRRFFDITTLAAIRVDDPRVFADTHRLVLGWLHEGAVDGVRIDHPDGLRDPTGYFDRLRQAAPASFIIAEKILHPGEALPEEWPIEGTTGYDFAQRVTGLFIDPTGEGPLTELYHRFTGEPTDFRELSYQCRHQVMRELLGSDIRRLLNLLSMVCQSRRQVRDYTQRELEQALREVIACFPMYRTYVHPDRAIRAADRKAIATAIGDARRRNPAADGQLFDFLEDLLLLTYRGGPEDEFVARFQETTAPVTAKAIEDTALYRFNRLTCLNEVGSDPSIFSVSPAEFHAACAATLRRWPRTMLTGSTHDTKRSEDMRVRLALLSEIPDQWERAVERWSALTARYRRDDFPDRNMEYLMYQTMVGAYPIPLDRLQAFAHKAAKEAKAYTSWVEPNERYEAALRGFLEGADQDASFQADLSNFVEPLLRPGWVNALSARLLTLTAPGVADLYQGTELWDLSLVDPDNRRRVDFAGRQQLLAGLSSMGAGECWGRAADGYPKLLVTARALLLRSECGEAFGARGSYEPLSATGPVADRVLAFVRGGVAIAIVPRLALGRSGWCDTSLRLPPGHWSNVLTGGDLAGGDLPVAELLREFPVALLRRQH